MHFQASTVGWLEALVRMPDYSVLKGFDAGLLREGKQVWAAAGRDPKRLTTVLRHAGVETSPRGATWEEAKEHWRKQFWKFIDGTYLRELSAYVDVVSDANEYWADSTWQDPDGGLGVKRSMLAAQAVWNDEFRGRLVTNPNDGGQGRIGADVRIALGAVTVSFGFPRDLLAAVVAGDNIADMHCYTQCVWGERAPDDWRNCSGLFHFQEQAYGLKPRWLFGESGPFIDTDGGWRRADCLNGDEGKLVSVMASWWDDLTTTPAYREGRLVGAGCWFTSGNVGWQWYQLQKEQLVKLADVLARMWQPGEGDDGMDPVLQGQIKEQLDVISAATARLRTLAGISANWWDAWPSGVVSPARKLAAPNKLITFYHGDGQPFSPALTRNVTWEMDVTARMGNLLLVLDQTGSNNDWWVRAEDVSPKV